MKETLARLIIFMIKIATLNRRIKSWTRWNNANMENTFHIFQSYGLHVSIVNFLSVTHCNISHSHHKCWHASLRDSTNLESPGRTNPKMSILITLLFSCDGPYVSVLLWLTHNTPVFSVKFPTYSLVASATLLHWDLSGRKLCILSMKNIRFMKLM